MGSGSRAHGAKEEVSFEYTNSGSLHDAAVGALIRVFKSAQPLKHSSRVKVSVGFEPMRNSRGMRGASLESFSLSVKTAADALEELQLYQKTRDLLMHMYKEERGG